MTVSEIDAAIKAVHGQEFSYRSSMFCGDTAKFLGGSGDEIAHHFDNGEPDWAKRKCGVAMESGGKLTCLPLQGCSVRIAPGRETWPRSGPDQPVPDDCIMVEAERT